MAYEYPDICDKDWAGKDKNLAHSIIDFAVNTHRRRTQYLQYNRLYNAYNGIVKDGADDWITKTYGVKSKTKYIDYKLLRSKVKLLIGEHLELGLDATVYTINKDAQINKIDQVRELAGLMEGKQHIESVRQMGLNAFAGMAIPEKNDKNVFDLLNAKTKNEMAMQHIINEKIKKHGMREKFNNNWVDTIIVSECFGKVERNQNGVDDYRPISPKDAMYQESANDPFLLRSPYLGERRLLFQHEIMNQFDLSTTDQPKLREIFKSGSTLGDDYTSDVLTRYNDGNLLSSVYTIQWKAIQTVRKKITPARDSDVPYINELSQEYYEKNQKSILNDVQAGKYRLETYYREQLWEITRIGADMYTIPRLVDDQIQTRLDGKTYKCQFDYTGMLFGTVDGTRVSLMGMGIELSEVYNIIRFQINREISKIKGTVLLYNRAWLPKGKNMEQIMNRIVEDSVVDYTTSDDDKYGNQSGLTPQGGGEIGIKEITLGDSRILPTLIAVAQDIERTLDRLTGINDNRQGITPATQTATATSTNLTASRSMTYDMFFYIRQYEENSLMKLAEKTKLNEGWLQAQGNLILSDGEKKFLLDTQEISNDDYGMYLSDSRLERDVKDRIRSLYEPQINARELTTHDIAEAELQDTFAGYYGTLKKGWETIKQAQQAEMENKAQIDQQAQENALKFQQQQAEAENAAKDKSEKDMILLQGEVQKDIDNNKANLDKGLDTHKSINQAILEPQDNVIFNK